MLRYKHGSTGAISSTEGILSNYALDILRCDTSIL